MEYDRDRLIKCLNYDGDLSASERYVYNSIAYCVIRGILIHTHIAPNKVTAFWGVLMLVSSLGFLLGDYRADILCGIGWVFAYALDCADGPWARYSGLKSRRGDYIDGVNHRATYPLVMFCIGYRVFSDLSYSSIFEDVGLDVDPLAYLLLGVAAGICMVLIIDVGNIYNRICPEKAFASNAGIAEVESRNVKDKERFKKIMRFSPAAFTNMIALMPVFAALGRLDLWSSLLFCAVAAWPPRAPWQRKIAWLS